MNLSENIKAVQSMPSWEKAESSFMTSLDIVQEVMNVPMCALTSLLRSYGYDSIDDTSSLCIDEKRLEIFADAYVRKIRSYFTSSLRNISKLSQKELEVLEQFLLKVRNRCQNRHLSCVRVVLFLVYFQLLEFQHLEVQFDNHCQVL